MAWVPGGRSKAEGDEKFAAAMRAASETSLKVRSLIDQLKPYQEADDPFAAIVEAHDRAVRYEQEQEKRIFLGPSG
jgi:hypothetical protein